MSASLVPPALARLRGGLVVSCQAYPGEPMRHTDTMRRVAAAVLVGGADGIRANGPDDVAAIRAETDLPVIGLWKDGQEGVYITPTVRHALAVSAAGADIVAIDGTGRDRPDGLDLAATIARIHDEAGAAVLADVSTVDEGVAAARAGADAVSSTLSGYTPDSPPRPDPDLDLVRGLVRALDGAVPVLAEGRLHTPELAAAAMRAGAWAVVVGSAITHPTSITRRFAAAVRDTP